MRVGDKDYDGGRVLNFLHNLMKNFPKLKAQEILWSYFIPNDKALEEAQEDGRPVTLNEVITEVINNDTEFYADIAQEETFGIYKLQMIEHTKFLKEHPDPVKVTCMMVIANSHQGARSEAAGMAGRYSVPPTYKSDPSWRKSSFASCNLIAEIHRSRVGRYSSILFAGQHMPTAKYRQRRAGRPRRK